MAKQLCVLGATGSIGDSTLDLIEQHPQSFELYAFSAHTNVDKALSIIERFAPKLCVMVDENQAKALKAQSEAKGFPTEILDGAKALDMISGLDEVDLVVGAIVGAAGLSSLMSAVDKGKTIALANKEALVMTGPLFMERARKTGASILPIDSEHNALFQCMPGGYQTGSRPSQVKKIILTASGGPFFKTPQSEFESITVEQAVAHPKWDMGAKISIDSATLMNKGLEVIEAALLFDMKPEDIEVIIHPQSIIHSMVCYEDGSHLAQLGTPDMRIPISACLNWPKRVPNNAKVLDFSECSTLEFHQPDYQKFPCLKYAFEALKAGDLMPCLLNGANEIAVASFRDKKIKFSDIPVVVEKVMNQLKNERIESIEHVLKVDAHVRQTATQIVQHLR